MSKHKPYELFHNRYKLLKLIAEGGMSEVWTAVDEHGDEEEIVALKIYDDHVDRKSLNAEYALMRKFNHPNLLRPDYFVADDSISAPFMVMKYYSRGSASTIINNSEDEIKAIDEKLIAQFILSAAKALYTIQKHEKKIIHQDIKPDNFLINDEGEFVLADFGVSTVSKATRQIKSGNQRFSGSTAYVAPERFNGAPPRFSQDIFSLGVTIYEILTGVLPFQEHGGLRLNQGFPVPDLDPAFGYSARLNSICKRCMDIEPEARPLTSELIEWSEFYIKNGHWPQIPQIDSKVLKAERLYKSTKLSYERILNCKLNELDHSELLTCINNFNEIQLISKLYPEINDHLIYLYEIKNDLDYFENFENQINSYKSKRPDKREVQELRNKYLSFATKIPDREYREIIKRIEDLGAEATLLDQIESQLKSYISRPIDEHSCIEISKYLEQNKNVNHFDNEFKELQLKVSLYNKERKDSIELLKRATALAGEASNLLFLVQNEKDSDLDLTKFQINNCIKKFRESLSLVYDKTIDFELSKAIKEKERIETIEKKKKGEEKPIVPPIEIETARNLVSQTDYLFLIVNSYIQRKDFTTKTLKENLGIIENVINKYSEVLSIAPGLVSERCEKAYNLKERILYELRRKRRRFLFRFLQGAAILGFGIFIYFIFKISYTNPPDDPVVVTSDTLNTTNSTEAATSDNPITKPTGNLVEKSSDNPITKPTGNLVEKSSDNPITNTADNSITRTEANQRVASSDNKMNKTEEKPAIVSTNKPIAKTTETSATALPQYQGASEKEVLTNSCSPQISQKKASYRISKRPIVLTCESPCGDGDFNYEWRMIRGENCDLSGQNTNTLIISNYKIGDYEFRVVKKNKNGIEISNPVFYTFKVAF